MAGAFGSRQIFSPPFSVAITSTLAQWTPGLNTFTKEILLSGIPETVLAHLQRNSRYGSTSSDFPTVVGTSAVRSRTSSGHTCRLWSGLALAQKDVGLSLKPMVEKTELELFPEPGDSR